MRRILLATASVCGVSVAVAFAASPPRVISTSGLRLTVPGGWHATVSRMPGCDPERLVVASSAPLRLRAAGRVPPPTTGTVVVVLLEDRQAKDRPLGDLRRPKRFSIDWTQLRRLDGGSGCGLPETPMSMRYFEQRGRYLGFIVFPGSHVGAAARRATLALLDSLALSGR